jgi:hypothetical protein
MQSLNADSLGIFQIYATTTSLSASVIYAQTNVIYAQNRLDIIA